MTISSPALPDPPLTATPGTGIPVEVPVVLEGTSIPWGSIAMGAAARTLFHQLESLCEGAVVVDTSSRVVWINDKYARRFGLQDAAAAIGRDVEEVIPSSRMREVVIGKRPIVLDIMPIGNEHGVVTRIPLTDETGIVVGAVGFVLYDKVEGLRPILTKAERLQVRLTAAELELAENRRARYSLAAFIGDSAAAREIKRQARRAALLDSTVLLGGETGTGKELLAQAIHNLSPRAHRPFVSVNAAAIPEALLEAELFGAAPGAYTGADRRGRHGKFKVADGGTLFLDEVGDMPLALQAKLLRVLQEREIEPLGSNRLIPIDVRVIAATAVDLQAKVASGLFRADLYYRLDVLSLKVPPLRERLEDLPMMAERFLDQIGSRLGLPLELDAGAVDVLLGHAWPGNVRELHNVLERTVMMNEAPRLMASHVAAVLGDAASQGAGSSLKPAPRPSSRSAARPESAGGGPDDADWGLAGQPLTLAKAVADAERRAIAAALACSDGNKAQAARALGISRAALYDKLRQAATRPDEADGEAD